jgi:Citrate transporter/PDZ domain
MHVGGRGACCIAGFSSDRYRGDSRMRRADDYGLFTSGRSLPGDRSESDIYFGRLTGPRYSAQQDGNNDSAGRLVGGSFYYDWAVPGTGWFLLAVAVSELMSNSGTVALLGPITISVAPTMGINPMSLLAAITFGSSAAFAMPIGYQTSLMIYGPGGYRFKDFIVMGIPLAGTPPGQTVTLRIWRDGSEQELRSTLGELAPTERSTATTEERPPERGEGDTGRLGLAVQPLTSNLASQLGIRGEAEGLVVMEVDPFGPAADAGIQRGDVIEQVNQQPARSVADLGATVERSGKNPLLLLVNHRGTTIFLTIRPR